MLTVFLFFFTFYSLIISVWFRGKLNLKASNLVSRWRQLHAIAICKTHKKAVLSQIWPRNAPYRFPENFWDSLTTPTALCPTFSWAFVLINPMNMFLQNLKSVALHVLEIIGGIQKFWAVSGYAHAPFSPKFLTGFYSDGPCKYTCQIWSP